MLGDRGDTGGQAAGQADQNEFDRSRTLVLGSEQFGVVGFEGESLVALLLFAEAEETVDTVLCVGAANPVAGCAPVGGSTSP